MLGSECNLKMYVRYLGYPLKSGAQKPPTETISQLNSNFSCLYLRNETRCTYLGKCFGNYKLYRLKMSWTLVHKRLKVGP